MTGPKTSVGNPKSKSAKNKGMTLSVNTTHPWPRTEGTKFPMPDDTLPVHSDSAWDQSDAFYYNNWTEITIEPTRFICASTLKSLGLHNGVTDILLHNQLLELCSHPEVLYPDLVRQCLASAQLTYANPRKPVASEGVLSFSLNGKKHSITIKELCDLYGFDSTPTAVKMPSRLTVCNAFWNFIANGPYYSRKAAQSSIRNPSLRIAAKAISVLLFAREDTSKVRVDELFFLYNSVKETIAHEQELSCSLELDVNLGAVFAEVIAEKRTKAGPGKTEKIGSLLTRLFEYLGHDLSTASCNEDVRVMDISFLINCQIMVDTNIYRFTGRDDCTLFCRLPQPTLTELDVAANVGFLPGTAYLCSEAGDPIFPESTDEGAAAPGDLLSDEEREGFEEETINVQRSRANWRRPYRSELTLRDISDTPSDQEYRSWMVDSTKKSNGLMRRILHMLQKGCSGSAATATMPSTSARPAATPSAPPSTAPSSSGRQTRATKRQRAPSPADVDTESD